MAVPFNTVVLDKPYQIRMGMRETVEFEQLTGLKATDLQGILTMDIISKLLWIMLKKTNPELTLDKTMSLVDDYADDISSIALCVTTAINTGFGAKSEPSNPQPPAAKPMIPAKTKK